MGVSAVVTVMILIGSIALVRSQRREIDRMGQERTDILSRVARSRGGRSGTTRAAFEIAGVRIDVILELDAMVQPWAPISTWKAALPAPGTARFKLFPRSEKSLASIALGLDEIETADRAFDDHFVMRSPAPAHVRALWTEALRALALHQFRTATLSSTGAELELRVRGVAHTVANVERGIELLLAIARVDVFGLDVLRSLPDAVLAPSEQPGVYVKGPGAIWIGLHEASRHVRVTRARGDASGLAPFPPLRVALDRTDAAELAPLPERLRARARELGDARIENAGGEVSITWDEIERTPERLVAAIELLRGLAGGPSLGVFR